MRKYRNSPTVLDGVRYDSAAEARYAAELQMLTHARDRKEKVKLIERQVPYEMWVEGVQVAKHVVDFRVTFADGRVEVHEVKGMATDTWVLKYKLFRALFPNITYRIMRTEKGGGFYESKNPRTHR